MESILVLPLIKAKNSTRSSIFSLFAPAWGQFHVFANIKTWGRRIDWGVALFPPPPPPPGLQFAISRLPHFFFLRPIYHCKQVAYRRGGCKKGSINLGWKKGGGRGLDGGGGGGPGVQERRKWHFREIIMEGGTAPLSFFLSSPPLYNDFLPSK